MQKIEYEVKLKSAHAHLFEVTCHIKKPDSAGQILSLPAWIPGSYLIRDFARHIVRISASSDKKAVAIEKINKHTWQCTPVKNGTLTVCYEVYAFDLSVRMAYFDTTRAYFNGTSLFLQVHGYESLNCNLKLLAPEKPFHTWQVATSMTSSKVDQQGFGTYTASNYHELIDCPFEIGELSIVAFKAGGKPHRLIISGKHDADLKMIAKDLKRLCDYHIDFFGEAPFSRYDFLLYAAGDDQYGGLEHSNSTSLICPRSWLPSKNEALNKKGYQDFLGLCSHEYFHAWHVKRIKPTAFISPDLGQEAYTRLLWVFEGFTAYYDSLALLKCGLISREDYLAEISTSITRLLNIPGRQIQALLDSSFDAWIKLYRPDENSANSQVSYYLKGSLVAMLLDLTLRQHNSSLDAVMKLLWQRHGKSGTGVNETEIERIAEEVSGLKLGRFFDHTLRSTEELNFTKLLDAFGIEMQLEISGNQDNNKQSATGFKLAAGTDAKLATVFSGSAAEKAGLAGGDTVIAINQIRVNARNIESTIARKAPGSKLTIHAFRRDELMIFEMSTDAACPDSCKLVFKKKPSKSSQRLQNDWLT